MTDNNTPSFNKLVPGFDFLQGLVKNAGAALPSIGQWVAPTLNPEELEKRIEELRTVQFWLEQNARMLAATIQALEVQRMTLSTLKTMNVPLTQLRQSIVAREGVPAAAASAPQAVDPMQWWGALTKQFTQLAATAMKDSAGGAAKSMAGAMVKHGFDAAGKTMKHAARAPGKMAGAAAKVAKRSASAGTAPAATHALRNPALAQPQTRRGAKLTRAAGTTQDGMARFLVGHATHPDWKGALELAAAQLDGQRAAAATPEPALGLVYLTDHHAPHAESLYAALHARWPGVAWAGTVGIGVCAGGVEYFDEPALVLMLCDLPPGRFRVFSGARPVGSVGAQEPAAALVHADARTHDLAELLGDLSGRTTEGYLFGGVASTRTRSCQIAEGVFEGGLSGVAFSREVGLVSRVTQGCQPIGPSRRVTACEGNVVTALDERPALRCLLDDLQLTLDPTRQGAAGQQQEALLMLRHTLVGLSQPGGAGTRARHGAFGDEVRVRHLVGLDPARHGVAVADVLQPGMALAFCQRDVNAARRDLTRICAEIRDELAPDAETAPADATARIRGALYFSCVGRGGPHFGAPSAELQLIRHALGDVPLAGFFAAGEIAHQQLYGYTGVLTVFTSGG